MTNAIGQAEKKIRVAETQAIQFSRLFVAIPIHVLRVILDNLTEGDLSQFCLSSKKSKEIREHFFIYRSDFLFSQVSSQWQILNNIKGIQERHFTLERRRHILLVGKSVQNAQHFKKMTEFSVLLFLLGLLPKSNNEAIERIKKELAGNYLLNFVEIVLSFYKFLREYFKFKTIAELREWLKLYSGVPIEEILFASNNLEQCNLKVAQEFIKAILHINLFIGGLILIEFEKRRDLHISKAAKILVTPFITNIDQTLIQIDRFQSGPQLQSGSLIRLMRMACVYACMRDRQIMRASDLISTFSKADRCFIVPDALEVLMLDDLHTLENGNLIDYSRYKQFFNYIKNLPIGTNAKPAHEEQSVDDVSKSFMIPERVKIPFDHHCKRIKQIIAIFKKGNLNYDGFKGKIAVLFPPDIKLPGT